MATKITNSRNRPNTTEYSAIQEQRGSGQLNSFTSYLKNDPVSYFYQKFKGSNNPFLRDDYWAEAAKRGESDNLVALLNSTTDESFDRKTYDALSGYGDRMDYDAYMLALQIPQLDNEKKIDRIDEATGTNFGQFTDREWGMKVAQAMTARWDAEIVEEDKANRGWLKNAQAQLQGAGLSVLSGVYQFVGDIWNLGEGLLTMLVDWSNDSEKDFLANRGEKFLSAFANDDTDFNIYGHIGEWLQAASFEYQRKYATTVNAVAAYEQGYLLGEGSNFLQQLSNSTGVGTGYTTWGRWMNAGSNAIGYMLPTIALGVLTGGSSTAGSAAGVGAKIAVGLNKARSAIFYAGIFSGMIKDTVVSAQMRGISYKDLDSGKVLANAAVKAAAQYAIEVGLGMVLGFSGVDRLLGMGSKSVASAGNSAARAAAAGGGAAVKNVLLAGAKSAGKEGLEETLQELSDMIVDYAFGGDYRERAVDNFSLQTLTDAFIVGALTSVVMGSMRNVSVMVGANRAVGIDVDGEAFKLGAFQTLSLRQAVESMHEWRETINDDSAKIEDKAKAMLSLNAAISTLGDVYRNMGNERAVKADTVIMDILNMESKIEQIKAFETETDYANSLWTDFQKAQANASAKYLTQQLDLKLKKAIDKEKAKLMRGKVTKMSDVITAQTDVNDPNLETSKDSQQKLQNILAKLGVEAIVGVDGNIVIKSDEVVFANKDLLAKGDIEAIVKGVAYDLALESVKAKLSTSQQALVIKSYNQVTGLNGTLDDAVTALMFDKQFYTFMLLRMNERHYKNSAFEILATIDQLITNKLTPNVVNNTITEKAYKTLLTKVQKTMQAGLVTFATNHQKINLGLVDNAVLPIELKSIIANHKNVRFTEVIDEGLKDKSQAVPAYDRITEFESTLNKVSHLITKEEADQIREKAKSTNYNDRVDAYVSLIYLSKSLSQDDKVVYLPAFETSSEVTASIPDIKRAVEEQFGESLEKLIDGTFDPNKLTPEIQDFIVTNGYNMSNTASRLAAIKAVLFAKSSKTLTLGNGGVVLKVLEKSDLVKPEYLSAAGQKVLIEGLKDGSIKTLQDIGKIGLPSKVANLQLVLDPSLVKAGRNGAYVDGTTRILLSGIDIINTIMHEATHYTQSLYSTNENYLLGGTSNLFSILPNKVRDSILSYLKANFKLSYQLIKNAKNNDVSVMYFMLGGELQANSTIGTVMFEAGFSWKNDRSILVSPDGTQEWSMAPSKQKTSRITSKQSPESPYGQSLPGIDPNQISEDRPLTPQEVKDLTKDPKIAKFVKGSMFVEDGVPIVFYRGSTTRNKSISKNKTMLWFSNNLSVAYAYSSKTKANSLEGVVTNLKSNEVEVIDVNENWAHVPWNNGEYTTDEVVDIIKETKPNIKAVLFKNIEETMLEAFDKPTDTLAVIDKTTVMKVTTKDSNAFINYVSKNLESKSMWDETDFDKVSNEYLRDYERSPKKSDDSNYEDDNATDYEEKPNSGEYLGDYERSPKKPTTNSNNKEKANSEERTFRMSDEGPNYEDDNVTDYEEKSNSGEYLGDYERSPLPEKLSADDPLTPKALRELRDDPTIARYMEKGWLKREDGTPMLWYRGWKARYRNTEIHLAKDGKIPTGNKGGEFYSSDYSLSKEFGEKLQGFITNVTREQTRVYELANADWLDLKEFYSAEDLRLHKKIFEITRPFTTVVPVAKVMSMGKDVEPFIISRLGPTRLRLWNNTIEQLMTEHGVDRDTAVTVMAIGTRWTDASSYRTDELIPINLLQGYKAIIMNEVNEVLGQGVATNLVMLRGTAPKRVTHSNRDINWDKVIKPESTRYISNQLAKQSNLKYFIKKGMPIQLDPSIAAFVSNTTDGIDKLPKILQEKIYKGKLNKFDLIDFVSTAKSMNDYTFQAIAKYIYHNEVMAKLTFTEASRIMEDIADLAALHDVVRPETKDLVRTPSEFTNLLKVTNRKANNDPDLAASLLKAKKIAQNVKLGNTFYETFADIKQLMPIMMRHYAGTLTSIRHVNNFGKLLSVKQESQRLIENADTDKINVQSGTWNWIDKIRRADIDYEYDEDIADSLDDITRDDKIDAITDYITNELISRVSKMTQAQKVENAAALQSELKKSISDLDKLSDEAIDKRYLAVLANETTKPSARKLGALTKPEPVDITTQPRSTKNIKDHLRQAGRMVTIRIAGLKRRYNSLPESVKLAIDPKTYKLKPEYYSKMTDAQLETLLTNMKEAAKRLNASIKDAETKAVVLEQREKRLATLGSKEIKGTQDPALKKTLKDKVDVVHKTTIVNQNFSFDSRENITKSAKAILETQWKKRGLSQVKGLNNNIEQNIHNGKVFFEYNAEILLDMTTADAEATAKWFIDANMIGIAADSAEAQTFTAIKTYFLGYVLSQAKDGGAFHNFSPNLRKRLEDHLSRQTSVAGTALAVWNNIQGLINPLEVMMSASMEIAGVVLTDAEKESLLLAAVSQDMDAIAAAQQLIIERVNIEKTTKKNITRKLTTLRSMSMLSNPVTWLRNKISNVMLKRLNKVASIIGNKIATNKTASGQFRMDGKITPEIQAFINKNFIDNKLFSTLVSNISRYNPSDIQARFKDATGKAAKEAIFANMVIKSLYNEFYNQNMFKSQRMNDLHKFLMKMLSDNNYVREASVRYFGKIMAERGYALDQGVTDAIMNDFAVAIGMGMADYMHSDNAFNQVETILAEKSEALLFAYKLILPFGAASWNWFKAAMRFSPVGLGQSIYKLATLEQQIIKAESNWAKGKGQVSPELTEFLIRRDLGSGVIGTMSMLFGMILAGLGYVELEEEDYGVPKLRIGNLRIDVSTIFGSSSVLAGMALVKGWDKGDYMAGIDAMVDPMLDGFFLVQILEMDRYNNKGWASMGVNFVEQTLLSFIPNGFRWLSGATYTGKYKTNNFFERAVSRIPFFGSVFGLEKRANPYTGDLGDAWDIFNRVVPFFEVRQTSFIENTTKTLGINKDELRGKYEVNGEKFELSSEDTAALNRLYGQWNADALVAFYNNETRYSVKTANGTFKTLTYNQMTEEERRNAVRNIFSKHAEYAKIYAWLKAGNAYYASQNDYVELKKLGIAGALYKGNRGFVSK